VAVYYLCVKTASRLSGGSAGGHALYILREGHYQDLRKDLEYAVHFNMPFWARENPLEFWCTADEYERANGRLYVELQAALPRELSLEARVVLAQEFAKGILGERHPYTLAIHNSIALDGGEQPHFHLMFSERVIDGIEREREHFFRRANSKHPERGGALKEQEWHRPLKVFELREAWERHANGMLALEGHEARIDCRSLKEQGIARQPEPKLGAAKTAMLMQGIVTKAAAQVFTMRQQRIQYEAREPRQGAFELLRADELLEKVFGVMRLLESQSRRLHEEQVSLGLERFWGVGEWHYPPPITEEEARKQAYIELGGAELKEAVNSLRMREIEYHNLKWRLDKHDEKERQLGFWGYLMPHEALRLNNERSFLARQVAEFNARSRETSHRYNEVLTRLSSQPEVERYVARVLSEQKEREVARAEVDHRQELLEKKLEIAREFAAGLRVMKDQELLIRHHRAGELPQVVDERTFKQQVAKAQERKHSQRRGLELF